MSVFYNVIHAYSENRFHHASARPADESAKIAQREHRTISELFREALRRYMAGDTQWDSLLTRTRAKGKALGVSSEADVERLSDEYRRDKKR